MALFLSKRNIYLFFFKLDFVITWRIYRAKMDFFCAKMYLGALARSRGCQTILSFFLSSYFFQPPVM